MTDTHTSKKRSRKNEKNDDLSKNNGKQIKYRLREQQSKEADNDIREFKDGRDQDY